MIPEAGEITQWLRVCTILAAFPYQDSYDGYQLPVALVLKDPIPFSGLDWHYSDMHKPNNTQHNTHTKK